MYAQELRQLAKVYARKTFPHPMFYGTDTDELIDAIIDAAVKAAVVEIVERHQVDVPNTGYFGIIVKRESK